MLRRSALGLAAATVVAVPAHAQGVKVDRVDIVNSEAIVAGKQGAELALVMRVSGRPAEGTVALREIWRLPPPGARDPATGRVFLETESEFKAPLNSDFRRAYVFDQPWKIVRGEWVVEYWDGVRKMMLRKFVVQ